jgi:putative membrane protein
MRRIILSWAVNTVTLLLIAYLVPWISFNEWRTAIIAGLLLGLFNTFVRPVMLLLTLPFTLITLGLFVFIINGLMLYIVARILPGFVVSGFWGAVGSALLFSIISSIINAVINPGARPHIHFHHSSGRRVPEQQHYDKVIDAEVVHRSDDNDIKKLR